MLGCVARARGPAGCALSRCRARGLFTLSIYRAARPRELTARVTSRAEWRCATPRTQAAGPPRIAGPHELRGPPARATAAAGRPPDRLRYAPCAGRGSAARGPSCRDQTLEAHPVLDSGNAGFGRRACTRSHGRPSSAGQVVHWAKAGALPQLDGHFDQGLQRRAVPSPVLRQPPLARVVCARQRPVTAAAAACGRSRCAGHVRVRHGARAERPALGAHRAASTYTVRGARRGPGGCARRDASPFTTPPTARQTGGSGSVACARRKAPRSDSRRMASHTRTTTRAAS